MSSKKLEVVSEEEHPEKETNREGAMRAARAQAIGKRTRSSVTEGEPGNQPSAFRAVQGLFNSYRPLGYMLPWETLDYVELLSTYNPDYSQAVENMKMIANSGHTLMVNASSKLKVKRLKNRLEEKARTIQVQHGGIDGVIDKLMDQACTYGAMCGEVILNEELDDVVDFADLNPKNIRFFWDEEIQNYAPYQKVNGAQAKQAEQNGQDVINDCIKLNPLTFRYYAFDAAPESPYGTPPFLAALANIAIQRDLISNMAQIVKKIGLLGIVDLSIERLEPLTGETDEAYAQRAGKYLSDYVDVAEEMVKEGGIIHFDDVQANSWSIGGNAAGATNIHKANEEMVFSGLKSMPSIQGRSFSTTETYAGIAYDVTIRNSRKYQRAAKRMIESMYWFMATLWGEDPDSIKIVFNENRSLNRLQEAQSEKVEIQNESFKWLLGVIDQMQMAQSLGYSEPAIPLTEPPDVIAGALTAHGIDDPGYDFGEPDKTSATLEEDEET